MADKKKPPLTIEDIEELEENEEYLTENADIDMIIFAVEEDEYPAVYVKMTNFDDIEEAEDYAEKLKKNLPLLLLETTVKH